MSNTNNTWEIEDIIAILWLLGVIFTLILSLVLLLTGAIPVLLVLFPLLYVILTKSTRQKQGKRLMSICARIFH